MTRHNDIVNIVDGIIHGINMDDAMKYYAFHIDDEAQRTHINKKEIIKQLQKFLDSEPLEFSSADVAMSLWGYERKAITLSSEAKTKISYLIKLMELSINSCKHEHLAIIPLRHGGGFTPGYALIEVVCPDCWLNVTVKNESMLKYFNTTIEKDIGIKISNDDLKSIYDFIEECEHSPLKIRIQSASKIMDEPSNTYNSSQKYMGKYKIEIVDRELFESKSGV